jgi:hypothetical protein
MRIRIRVVAAVVLGAVFVSAGAATALTGETSDSQCGLDGSLDRYVVTVYSTPVDNQGHGNNNFFRLQGFDASTINCVGAGSISFVRANGESVVIAVLAGVDVTLGRDQLTPAGLWRAKLKGWGSGAGTGPTDPCAYLPDFILGASGSLQPAVC